MCGFVGHTLRLVRGRRVGPQCNCSDRCKGAELEVVHVLSADHCIRWQGYGVELPVLSGAAVDVGLDAAGPAHDERDEVGYDHDGPTDHHGTHHGDGGTSSSSVRRLTASRLSQPPDPKSTAVFSMAKRVTSLIAWRSSILCCSRNRNTAKNTSGKTAYLHRWHRLAAVHALADLHGLHGEGEGQDTVSHGQGVLPSL